MPVADMKLIDEALTLLRKHDVQHAVINIRGDFMMDVTFFPARNPVTKAVTPGAPDGRPADGICLCGHPRRYPDHSANGCKHGCPIKKCIEVAP